MSYIFCCSHKTPWPKKNLRKKEFILAYGSREKAHSGKEEMGTEAEPSKRTFQQEAEREQE